MRPLAYVLIFGFALAAGGCEPDAKKPSTTNTANSGDETLLRYLSRRSKKYPDTPAGAYSRETTSELQRSLRRDASETLERLRKGGVIFAAARVPDRDVPGAERVHVFILAPRKEVASMHISFENGAHSQVIRRPLPIQGEELWEDIGDLGTVFYIQGGDEQAPDNEASIGSLPVINVPKDKVGQEFLLSIEWKDGTRTNSINVGRGE